MYVPDYKTYDRGFYFKIKDLPFMIAYNNQSLNSLIASFDNLQYADEVDSFLHQIHSNECGKACEQIYNIIENIDK